MPFGHNSKQRNTRYMYFVLSIPSFFFFSFYSMERIRLLFTSARNGTSRAPNCSNFGQRFFGSHSVNVNISISSSSAR